KTCCRHWTRPPTPKPPTSSVCAPRWTWCRPSSRPAPRACTCTPSTPPARSSTCCTTPACAECPPLLAEHATGRRPSTIPRSRAATYLEIPDEPPSAHRHHPRLPPDRGEPRAQACTRVLLGRAQQRRGPARCCG